MDSSPLYTPKRRCVRSSRLAYPLFFLTIAFISVGIVWMARTVGASNPIVANMTMPNGGEASSGGAVPADNALTTTPTGVAAGGTVVNNLPTLTPTPLPQFRAEPQSVRADCQRTAIHGHVYTGEYGVNDIWIRVWFAQGGMPSEWQALTGSNPAWGNGGYEIWLDEKPIAGQWYIAVVDERGAPVSEVIPIESTDTGCNDGSGQQIFHLNFLQTAQGMGRLALLSEPTATPYPTASPFPTFTPTLLPAPTLTPVPEPIPPSEPTTAPGLPTLVSDGTGRSVQVPILMYHYISVPPANADSIRRGLSVGPDVFRAHLITLREQGFTSITLTELAYAIQMGNPLPPKPIIITFDDGYRDSYTNAYPILKEEGFVGTFFVFTDPVDERNNDYLTWEMVKEMQEGGMEIGSHTLSHLDLPGRSAARIQSELQESRRILEEKLGIEVRTFAYPYGDFDTGVAHLVKEAGYWIAVTTRGGTIHTQNNIMTLERVRVTGGMFPNRLMDILYDHCDVYDEC